MRRWLGCLLSAGFGLLGAGLLLAAGGGASAAPDLAPAGGTTTLMLLVPDSDNDRVMAFDATTGDLLYASFIPPDPTNLSTPKNVILDSQGELFLVSDQVEDVVQAYNLDRSYAGVFAPVGGEDLDILNNNVGIALRPSGHLLVAVAGATTTQDLVAEFDAAGNFVGNFIPAGSGGLDSPFDIFARGTSDWLVTGFNSNDLRRYDFNTGAFITTLASINTSPQQIALASNNNILVANFDGTQEGIVELTPGGVLVDVYTATTLSDYRGVYELPNGNLLVSTSNGVYEISRASTTIVDTKISGVSAQYIELVAVPNQIELRKTVGVDPGVCALTSVITVPAFTSVTYCYEVINTGAVDLTEHDLADTKLGTLLNDFAYTLSPGASTFLTESAVITATTVNTATWVAQNPGPTDVTAATDSATVVVGGLILEKTVGLDPGVCAVTKVITLTVPGPVTYCYEITNQTAVELNEHDLTDDRLGGLLLEFAYTLSPGYSAILTETAMITQTTVNTAVWTAYNPGPANVISATAQARVALLHRLWQPLISR